MKNTINFILVVLVAITITSCGTADHKTEKNDQTLTKAPKYIFMFIGDGMGILQSTATERYLGSIAGENGISKLNMSEFPVHGLYTTYAEDRFITGSAAGGTALATGKKTSIGTISMDPSKEKPYKTVAEIAKEKGMKVGIVSSVSIDHATPASFYAHQPSRNMYYNISATIAKSNFDYFAGGGVKSPDGDDYTKDTTVVNSIQLAKDAGYKYVNTIEGFNQLKSGDDKIFAVNPRFAGGTSIPYVLDQTDEDITLVEFTKKGIELLDNPNGFFMMVEGGKIDWACHGNDAAASINEVLQFDEAVGEAVKFYNQHPDETLIIVCGDHETGGLSIGFSGAHYNSDIKLLKNQKTSSEAFTALVKQYKAETKKPKLSDIMNMIEENFGLGNKEKGLELTEFEKTQIKEAFKKSVATEVEKDDQYYLLYGSYEPITITACHILAQKAGISWTTYSHTATPIPARAMGVGADLYKGYFDNTDVSNNIIKLLNN